MLVPIDLTTSACQVVQVSPTHEAAASCDPRHGCPTTSQANVMLAIEKVGRIAWIQIHGFVTLKGCQRRACPFPKTSHIALTSQPGTVARHGSRYPLLEADIAAGEVSEEDLRIWSTAVGGLHGVVFRRRFLNAIVAEMPASVSKWPARSRVYPYPLTAEISSPGFSGACNFLVSTKL